jgi:hypothetical protein
MMDQPEISHRQRAPFRLWEHSKIREWKISRLSPNFDGSLDLGGPEQIGRLRRLRRFWHHGSRAVHVVAPDLMFGAIATIMWLDRRASSCRVGAHHCGNVSSQRMCLFLHVLHPFRDLVWLRLEGPPPGPAISVKGEGELAFSEGMKEVAQC